MNTHTTLLTAVPALTLALVAGVAFGLQDGGAHAQGKPAEAGMSMDDLMPKPTKEHQWLKSRIGTWDCTMTCQMMGPSKGVETTKAFGDFTITSEFKGDMMGQPFTGMSFMTYDPIKKKYVSTWCDTMMPAIFVSEGTMDATGKKLTSTGKGANMEGTIVDHTLVLEIKSDDEAVFTMYETTKGPDDPSAMRIDYKRRK